MEKASARLVALQHPDRSRTAAAQVRTGLITMVMTVLQTALIAWFGFALSGRIELALKERSMTLESAKALAMYVTDMQDPGKDVPAQTALVRKIAMFGNEAVEPLTVMAAATGPYKETIPLDGLKVVAVNHRKEACRALGNVVASKHLIDQVRFESIKTLYGELQC